MRLLGHINRGAAMGLVVMVAFSACGRSGYELLSGRDGAPDGEDGGMPDAGVPTDGGLPASCTEPMIVTTESDEDDTGESPAPPHLGEGLSLREAIALANAAPGPDCITFSGVTAPATGSGLPAITDDAGLILDGGGVSLGTTLHLASRNNLVRGLTVAGSGGVGIVIDADDNTLRDVHVFGTGSFGIHVAFGVEGTDIGPCLVHDNKYAGIRARGTVNLSVRHCTITANGGSALDAALTTSGLVVLNSIVFDNGNYGISVDDPGAVDTIDFSDVSGNNEASCNNCTPGANSIAGDPLFTDPLNDDYTLMAGSPAIDTGTDTGIDVNGVDPGLFNGLAPDMGALESVP